MSSIITVVDTEGDITETTVIKMGSRWTCELFEWLDNHGFGPDKDGVWIEDAPAWDCGIDVLVGEDAKCPRGYEYASSANGKCRDCEYFKTVKEIEDIFDEKERR